MISLRLLLPAVALAFTAAFAAPASAQSFSTGQRDEIGKVVREYLLANPELLEEVMVELQKRQQVAEAERHMAAVKANSEAIFNSRHNVVIGNPNGDVSFVEFFDYNCGYCKKALSDMVELMKTDPKLRIVLKEFPVLGPGSEEAAKVAVAVRMQDAGKKYLDFHTKLLMGRGEANKARAVAAAKEAGFDVARIEKDLASPEIQASLEESLKLAREMGLNGTPSYVIGPNVVVGAVGLDGLRQKIDLARCGKATC
jgi:protein-disulfide isomerase